MSALNLTPAAAASGSTDPGCAAGSTQFTFVNNSYPEYLDSQVYLAVESPAGSIISAGNFTNLSMPLSTTTFFQSASGVATHSYYFCTNSSASGRLLVSLGGRLSNPAAPLVSDPVRWGLVELGPPGSTGVDYSNVNNFDFALNMQSFTTPGGTTPSGSALFSANTCQVVNAMRTAVQAVGGSSMWNAVTVTSGGQFVRVVSPDNGPAYNAGWPDLTPYVTELSTGGPIVVEGEYVGSGASTPDPGNVGWYRYVGTFSGGNLVLNGTVSNSSGPSTSGTAGATMTVPLSALPTAIYNQAMSLSNYAVTNPPDATQPNNDLYAKVFNDLTSSFAYGYWGSAYGTGRDTASFWNPFSPPTLPVNGQPAFPTKSASYGTVAYNLYSTVLSRYSASYTMPFSENFGDGGKGSSPLLTAPINGEIRMTLPADGWVSASTPATCASAPPAVLLVGGTLTQGQSLVSASGLYTAVLQSDGNFVVYGPSGATWWTGTNDSAQDALVLQSDSNLVLYGPAGHPLWWTSTNGGGATGMVMQNDGNLVLYGPTKALWSTRTGRL